MNGDLIDATITQDRLSDWLGGPKALEEECKLDMSDDGFYVTVVDKANVAYIWTTLSPTAFESYDFGDDEKKVYGLSINKLSNAIGIANSDDLVHLLLDDEHSMRVNAGGVGFDHAGINPDTIRQRPEIPEIDYTTILENVPIENLKRGVKACDMVSDHLQFTVDPDEPDEWRGPFPEFDQYGRPTGEEYLRCPECGVEVLQQHVDRVTHADGCRFEEVSD